MNTDSLCYVHCAVLVWTGSTGTGEQLHSYKISNKVPGTSDPPVTTVRHRFLVHFGLVLGLPGPASRPGSTCFLHFVLRREIRSRFFGGKWTCLEWYQVANCRGTKKWKAGLQFSWQFLFWRFYWYPRMALGASLGLDDDQYKNRVSWSNLQMATQEQNLHRTEREQLDELK